MRDWYNAATESAATQSIPVTWNHVFTCWRALELDFHERFRADFGDGVLDRRPWRWFAIRVEDLLNTKTSRLATAVRDLISSTGGARV